jgi:methionyl-tRNA formyltransferase
MNMTLAGPEIDPRKGAASASHESSDAPARRLRIEFLTMDDPLYILPFFQEFIPKFAGEFDIAQVSCLPTMGKRPRKQLVGELLRLYKPAGFARLLARTAKARVLQVLPRSRESKTFHSIAQLCKAFGVPYERVGNPNSAEFVRGVQNREADVLVSVACPAILKENLLGVPPMGCINIHHAPLPRYKGMMPTFWQMYHGERQLGLTIHYMAARIDEGAALLQEELPIEPGSSLDAMIVRCKRHGAHCMAKVLRQMHTSEQQPVVLDQANGTYFTFPTPQEMREFHRRGLRAI